MSGGTSGGACGTPLCPCLPQDFVRIVKEKVKPVRKRELVAEHLPGSLNWKEYFAQYGLYIAGLVPNPHAHEMNVNHCWRFIRRSVAWLLLYPALNACFEQNALGPYDLTTGFATL